MDQNTTVQNGEGAAPMNGFNTFKPSGIWESYLTSKERFRFLKALSPTSSHLITFDSHKILEASVCKRVAVIVKCH